MTKIILFQIRPPLLPDDKRLLSEMAVGMPEDPRGDGTQGLDARGRLRHGRRAKFRIARGTEVTEDARSGRCG